MQGALFFDVGNIWFLGQGGYGEESQFKIDRFYKQLGFNTGLGARFDFSFFVFRIDWGIKLHNPNEAAGQRWIQNFRMQNTTLKFRRRLSFLTTTDAENERNAVLFRKSDTPKTFGKYPKCYYLCRRY